MHHNYFTRSKSVEVEPKIDSSSINISFNHPIKTLVWVQNVLQSNKKSLKGAKKRKQGVVEYLDNKKKAKFNDS